MLTNKGLIRFTGRADVRLLRMLREKKQVDEVDRKGMWVSPGIVDGHSHAGLVSITPIRTSASLIPSTHKPRSRSHRLRWGHLFPHTSRFGRRHRRASLCRQIPSTSTKSASLLIVEPQFDYLNTSKRIPSHWRHMQHALGENPDGVFDVVRMDNLWGIRESYGTARE